MNIALTMLVLLGATTFQETLDLGNEAYRTGDYPAAIRQYEQLISSSVEDPMVYYNLGNAYYKNQQLGYAIVNYERALHLDPDLTHARQNLMRAVANTKRGLAKPLPPKWEQSLFFWHYRLSYASTKMLAMVAWLLFWGVLGLQLWRPKRVFLAIACILGITATMLGVSLWVKARPSRLAVAVVSQAPVRFGASTKETVRFELYEGDRVLVDKWLRQADPAGMAEVWCRVETVGGERGWLKQDQLAFVAPLNKVAEQEQ